MPAQTTALPLVHGAQRAGNQRTHRGEDKRRIQRHGRLEVAGAGPARAGLVGQLLGAGVARASEAIDLTALCGGNLCH